MFEGRNEITITVDPVREEAKSRQEEVRTAAKNEARVFGNGSLKRRLGLSRSS